MTARDTSLAALNSIDLQAQENELLALIRYHFQLGRFTRKELAMRTGWTINRICGRVHSLREKGALTEYDRTRDGSHLLSIATETAAPAPAATGESTAPAQHCAPGKPVSLRTIVTVPTAAAEPHEALIHSIDAKGRPLTYIAVGFGPGWPPDQDRARGRR